MSKPVKDRKMGQKKTRQDWPLIVYVWIVGLGVFGYLLSRIALDGQPHPLHWAGGLVGAFAGYFIGWLWYHWRGDII